MNTCAGIPCIVSTIKKLSGFGTPAPEELLNIENKKCIQFLKKFERQLPQKMENMFLDTSQSREENEWNSLSLLRGFLQFNVVRDRDKEQKYQTL